jgi:hypothetical protein
LNFLFDHNLPPHWAAAIARASVNMFAAGKVEQVCHLRDRFPPNAADTEWLSTLGQEGGWTVVSGDAFRKKNGAERQVIRQYGLSVFVLQPSWSSRRYWDKLAQFILWWPRIVEQTNAVERATLEVPWRTATKFKQL